MQMATYSLILSIVTNPILLICTGTIMWIIGGELHYSKTKLSLLMLIVSFGLMIAGVSQL